MSGNISTLFQCHYQTNGFKLNVSSNIIIQNEKAFFTTVSNTQECVEKRGRRPTFLTTSRCFETVVKNYYEFFI